MLSSIVRVVARSAAIQLEEIAARSIPPTHLNKGKARAVEPDWEVAKTPIRRGDRLHGVDEASSSESGDALGQTSASASRSYPSHLSDLYRHSTSSEAVKSPLNDASADLQRAGSSTAPSTNLDALRGASSTSGQEDISVSSPSVQRDPLGRIQDDPSRPSSSAGASQPPAQRSPTLSESAEILGAVSIDQVIEGIPRKAGVRATEVPSPATREAEGTRQVSGVEPEHPPDRAYGASNQSEPRSMNDSKPSVAPMTAEELPGVSSSTAPAYRDQQVVLDSTEAGSGVRTDTGLAPEDNSDETPVILRASKVPSSRIGRFLHYGSLAASLGWGAASETLKRSAGAGSAGSVFMSDANIRRLVASLTRMRGAALKLGQFMSIQDNHMLPPEIERVLQQVQAHANYMPDWQMERVMSTELGTDWSKMFQTFDRTPIASASIGQVHRATLHTGEDVAVKVQFPGIRESITSDLSYLAPLLASSSILPRGLYLQNTIAVMKRELADECDYTLEAEAGRRFAKYLAGDAYFDVPKVIDEACTERVLTTAWMEGKPLSRMKGMSQATRDKIGTNILRLCLQELFHFRFMQTDPNWANFLYNSQQDRLGLIDFGASREYTKTFMDGWFALLSAALRGDRAVMKEQSEKIGYFTGEEEEVMINAHLSSMSLLAEPFSHNGVYDFANQTITSDVRKYIPIMLKHRLTPPPPETYSLNRKLSGAFLMCARLGARVDCRQLWQEWAAGYPYPEPDTIA